MSSMVWLVCCYYARQFIRYVKLNTEQIICCCSVDVNILRAGYVYKNIGL